MEYDSDLHLTDEEIALALADKAEKYPPILSLLQASDLGGIPLGTLRDWRSRGLLSECSMRRGREVRVWRNRFIKFLFTKHRDATKKTKQKV